MIIFVRKPESGVIHIRSEFGNSTQCAVNRWDTSDWEVVDKQEIQNDPSPRICENCLSTPRGNRSDRHSTIQKQRQHDNAVARASRPTREL